MSDYRRNGSDISSVIRILVSFFVIVISVASIYIVFTKISKIKILEKISLKAEPHDSITITQDSNTGNSIFITDEKGLKFRKEDKSFAREEWIDKNGELFYFDTAGYGLSGDIKKDGQIYTFENGKLKNIKRDTSYVHRAKEDLYCSVESAQYLVWLDDEENTKGFYPIKYTIYADDVTDYLGTINDKQYSSPNMIKIYMSDIYYLSVGKGTNFAGRLYRMRPGASHKETVGVGVTGYVVLSEDIVYYCDGQRVIKAQNWKGIEVKSPDDEEEFLDALSSLPDDTATASEIDEKLPDMTDILPDNKNKEETLESKSNEAIKVDAPGEVSTGKIRETTNNDDPVVPVIEGLPKVDEKVIKETAPIAYDRPGVQVGVAPN